MTVTQVDKMFSFDPIPLTPLDYALHPHPISMVLFFRVEDVDTGLLNLVEASESLLQFLPLLAGQIAILPGPDQKVNRRYIVPLSEASTIESWVEVRHQSLNISDFDLNHVALQHLVAPWNPANEATVTQITITALSDGIALCLTFNHGVFDASGGCVVLETLAGICQGLPPPTSFEQEVMLRNKITDIKAPPKPSQGLENQFIKFATVVKPELKSVPRLKTQRLTLSAPRVNELVKVCNSSCAEWETIRNYRLKKPCLFVSTNDVCTAALALCVARAKNLGSKSGCPSQEIHFGMAVGIRSQLALILDEDVPFMGNAIVAVPIRSQLPPIPESIDAIHKCNGVELADVYYTSYIASLVREQVVGVDEHRVLSTLGYLQETLDGEEAYLAGWGNPFSSLRKLSLYNLDFGASLGSIVDFHLYPGDTEGAVYTLPKRVPEAGQKKADVPLELLITLNEVDMDFLHSRPLFQWLLGKSSHYNASS
ncbi:hypothetical protein VE03_03828 [Pseudogymnoascus sp. 23342-1-I1]|nr:hypothetical protein VE03_03828 [Pseudogymnoascus sp. 23342-1-I1]